MSDEVKLLKQGAEARVFVRPYLGRLSIVKERFEKKYRYPELDVALTKERIKNEARAIVRCKKAGVATPALYLVDFVRRSIYMEYFEQSITVKEFIINRMKHESENEDRTWIFRHLMKRIGFIIRKMHDNDIIHGDLTTSNMLLVSSGADIKDILNSTNAEMRTDYCKLDLVLIDFGLSHVDSSSEDKGVDLYVLERALISTHNDVVVPDLFEEVLNSYEQYKGRLGVKETVEKFLEVRARGRKRTMVG